MIKKIVNRTGIDWLQFKILFLTSLKIELRENRGVGRKYKRKLSPLLSSLIFYIGMGLILAANLAPRTNPFMYSMLILVYSMVMSGFSVILEFGNSILNPDDWDVLTYRPINSRTYFCAKLSNLLFYIIIITTAMCLLPALIGTTVPGNNLLFPLVFMPVCYCAGTATAAFIVLMYTFLLKKINYQKFKDIIAYFQIGFSLFFFLFYQIIPRLGNEIFIRGEKSLQAWLYLIPPAWFAGIIQMVQARAADMDVHLGLIGICITILFITFAFNKISLQYAGLIANISTAVPANKNKKSVSDRKNFFIDFFRSFLKDPEKAAGFDLTTAMCRNDRSVKMGIYPLLGIPVAFLILAIVENEFKDPFIHGLFQGQGLTMFIIFIFMMMYSLTMLMKYSNDWEASWIFHLAPIESPGTFYQGVKYAVFIQYVLPFFILLGIIYAFFIPILHVLHFLISLLIFCLFFSAIVSFQINSYPFSEKRQKGERMRRFSFIIFVGPVFGLYALLYTHIFKMFSYWLIGQIGIIIIWKFIENLSVKKINKNLNTVHAI